MEVLNFQRPTSSTPNFSEFYPHIPYQGRVLDDIYFGWDYTLGMHEGLHSGSVGSAKSILMAHAVVRHCRENERAKLLLGRKALPDVKETIFRKILEHLEGSFIEGVHYEKNTSQASIKFCNDSEIISRSWVDKAFKKMRSLELSAAVIEELTENNQQDKEAYDEIKMRIGRLPHIRTNWLLAATNPDAPSHWVWKYFIQPNLNGRRHPTRHVYYSKTSDNPFLPPQYIDQLRGDLDPKMVRRMVNGEWIEIASEVIYYSYDSEKNRRHGKYEIHPNYPIRLSFDFNIGDGKPLSCVVFQYYAGEFHFFDECVIAGARTLDALEELAARGLFEKSLYFVIHGDASGKNRDTRNIKSDYAIIREYLANYRNKQGQSLVVEEDVPSANPAIRTRHNLVNAYCCNSFNVRRLFVYDRCVVADEGLRLSALKKGGQYIEDDSKSYQHISTAIGYGILAVLDTVARPTQETVRL